MPTHLVTHQPADAETHLAPGGEASLPRPGWEGVALCPLGEESQGNQQFYFIFPFAFSFPNTRHLTCSVMSAFQATEGQLPGLHPQELGRGLGQGYRLGDSTGTCWCRARPPARRPAPEAWAQGRVRGPPRPAWAGILRSWRLVCAGSSRTQHPLAGRPSCCLPPSVGRSARRQIRIAGSGGLHSIWSQSL